MLRGATGRIRIYVDPSGRGHLGDLGMEWPSQDAEAHFATLLEACLREGPQVVTRNGAEAAVLVPAAEWHRLQLAVKPSLKGLLLEDSGRFDLTLPDRSLNRGRRPPIFD